MYRTSLKTCDPENEVQLITKCSVQANVTDDQKLLVSDVENLTQRMKVQTLLCDGGFAGQDAAQSLEEQQIEQRVTGIKGRHRAEGQLGLDDFSLSSDEEGKIVKIVCPAGHEGSLRPGRKEGRYIAAFEDCHCQICPYEQGCPAKKLKKKELRVLRFGTNDMRIVRQREQFKEDKASGFVNQRASVESTVRSVIHPFGGHLCKLTVRGEHRITTMMVLSCGMVNIRRIAGYLRPDGHTKRGSLAVA